MANWRRSVGDVFWALDRALGGQRRPNRIQKWVARHPIGTGLCAAVPFTLFLLLVSPGEEPDDPLFAVFFGLVTGLVLGLTAASERLRQRRLKRLGMWDGS
ncbi:hypothetical protein [Streptomyces sp. NPDC058092]|uniref:hypothetical protein n=1 Tax=Streptomyces sp. NPDC058092 TaxID=3346336 RepID=UPI0036EE6BBF